MFKFTIAVLAVFSIVASSFPAYASLANRYPGDIGIETDPNVVFVENFEEGSIPNVLARWDDYKLSNHMSLVSDVPPPSYGAASLLMTHVGGEGNAIDLYTRLLPGYDELYYRFYVKIDTACNPIHHFVHMGGYNPPTSSPQGTAGYKPDGDDHFTTAIEPHGTSWRWDYYTYWMEMRSWQTPEGVPDPCNPEPPYYGNAFIREGADLGWQAAGPPVARGEWICVEVMVKMNNPTTDRNGEQAFWINGQLFWKDGQIVSHLGEGFPNGSWLRDKWSPDPDDSPFEGFRWRSVEDLNLNFFWLETYITTAPAGYVSKVWFDDIVIAKEYIGPISTTPVYSLTVNSGTGDGYYEENDVVPISADVISGLTFAEWTGDTAGIANIYTANTTITMPADDVTITATYTGTQTYLLTVNSGTGDGLHEEGQVVPIAADPPPPDEEFSHWVGDTAGIADVNLASTTITMPPQPVTITAMYKPLGAVFLTEEFGDATNTDHPGTVEDTYNNVGQGGDDNFSTDVTLNTYTWPVNTIANTTLIKWDLSAIPPYAEVTEATLYLYQVASGEDAAYENGVHKIINVNPVISACTWQTYNGTNSWTGGSDGGQADTAPAEDTPAVNLTNNEYKTWSVTNMVQDWVTTPSANYGMLVNSDGIATSDSHRFYASNEVADASTRPKLIVTYTIALTGDFEPDGDVDFADYAAFAPHFRRNDCNDLNDWCSGADFNHLDGVNLDDLKALTDNWLVGAEE
jgi:hypothetical protein